MKFKKNLKEFAKMYLYNSETHAILGRTCGNWAQIGLFFIVFYIILAIIFAIHLAIFLAITPGPKFDVKPWNFGKYAYMNYPNRPLELIMIPKEFNFIRGSANLGNFEYHYFNRLHAGAVASGVGNECLNRDNRYGFSIGQPCIFLHIAKVFDWTPELINSSLKEENFLPYNCTFTTSEQNVELSITSSPSGLPLKLNNNANSRSFPFRNQPNFKIPVMALALNLSALPLSLPRTFEGRVTCVLHFEAINVVRPRNNILQRLYEIPLEASTKITFTLS